MKSSHMIKILNEAIETTAILLEQDNTLGQGVSPISQKQGRKVRVTKTSLKRKKDSVDNTKVKKKVRFCNFDFSCVQTNNDAE